MGRRKVARCPKTNNHHPVDFPWSVHVQCTKPLGHGGMHVGRDYGRSFLWITESVESAPTN